MRRDHDNTQLRDSDSDQICEVREFPRGTGEEAGRNFMLEDVLVLFMDRDYPIDSLAESPKWSYPSSPLPIDKCSDYIKDIVSHYWKVEV